MIKALVDSRMKGYYEVHRGLKWICDGEMVVALVACSGVIVF